MKKTVPYIVIALIGLTLAMGLIAGNMAFMLSSAALTMFVLGVTSTRPDHPVLKLYYYAGFWMTLPMAFLFLLAGFLIEAGLLAPR